MPAGIKATASSGLYAGIGGRRLPGRLPRTLRLEGRQRNRAPCFQATVRVTAELTVRKASCISIAVPRNWVAVVNGGARISAGPRAGLRCSIPNKYLYSTGRRLVAAPAEIGGRGSMAALLCRSRALLQRKAAIRILCR